MDLTNSQSADEIIALEKARVSQQFKEHFNSEADKQYLQQDYQAYLDKGYQRLLDGNSVSDDLPDKKRYPNVNAADYPAKEAPQYALAISGGGIRSASFAIGVIQALKSQQFSNNRPSIFHKLSYLSTASGGGYAGSALSWYQKKFNFFPFGSRTTFAGSQHSGERENNTLNYIRQHGKYLTPNQLGASSLVGTVLLSIFHSLIAYTLLMCFLLLVLMQFFTLFANLFSFTTGYARFDFFSSAFILLVVVALLFAATTLAYGISSYFMHWLAKN